MEITYDFHGYDYSFDVPFEAIQEVFKEHYPEVDDIFWWLQFDENQEQFEDEFYDYFKDKFENQAYEEAKEIYMDAHDYHGVSRKDFF